MRRKLPAPTIDNDIFSRSCQSGILGHRLSNARLQQMLLVLLLLTGGMVLWMGNNRVWPDLHLLLVTHPGFTPHIGALAASSSTSNSSSSAGEHARAANLSSPATVTQPALQPQTLQALGESLEFPIWWHAPFISQSGLGIEALSIIDALIHTKQMAAEDIYISHSGDAFDGDVLKALTPATRSLLARRQHPQQVADEWINTISNAETHTQLQRIADWKDGRKAIAVCHNWFDCWRRPGESPSNSEGCPCPLGLGKTAYTIARTMFETAGLPAHLAKHAKAMDELWVPTQFNKDSFAAAGVDPAKIRIVPEGLDTTLWDPALHSPISVSRLGLRQATGPLAPPAAASSPSNSSGLMGPALPALPETADKPYIFLSVFKWEARKGWKDLVRGFCDAFKPTDNVVLWILTKPFMDSGEDFDQKVRQFAASHYKLTLEQVTSRLPCIYTSKEHLSEAEFIAVYKLVNALVIPTHGEGWGRPQIEAMAMELPVITTNWSGPTAFMNERVAYPLAVDGVSVVKSDGDPHFFKPFIGQKWAQPSIKHLVQLLRHVYSNPAEGIAKGKLAREHIEAHFTPQVVAGLVAAEVRRLQPLLKQRQLREQQERAQPGIRGYLSKLRSRSRP